jgi:hypothetical protein
MAYYELHAWCLLVLAWVFVPFYMRRPYARSSRGPAAPATAVGFGGRKQGEQCTFDGCWFTPSL